jgi:SAM-dependent methyltransferase
MDCHLCGSADVTVVKAESALRFVTSDARPWQGEASFQVCGSCATIQKVTDGAWQTEIKSIYAGYDIYQQSGGIEQQSFQEKGISQARSKVILEKLFASAGLPSVGRLLDLGCGNGGLLASMGSVAPRWQLYGTELNRKYQSRIESLPGVAGFFAGPVGDLPWSDFDLVTLIHLVEHIPGAGGYLQETAGLLARSGVVFVECPNVEANPFDLTIYDHCTHFSPATFTALCRRAGLNVAAIATDWIGKEISAIVGPSLDGAEAMTPAQPAHDSIELLGRHLAWLVKLAAGTRRLAAGKQPFGIFGSSIAAAWCQHQTGGAAVFFVDEDPARIGQTFMGRPIFAIGDEPVASNVLICLPGPDATRISTRIGSKVEARRARYITPDEVLA